MLMMWEQLKADPVARWTGVLLALILLPCLVPALRPDWLSASAEGCRVALILIAIVALQLRIRRVPRAERWFWHLWSLAFGAWLVPALWQLLLPDAARRTLSADLAQDVLYLCFYLFAVLAVESEAHLPEGEGPEAWQRALGAAGGAVFALGLIVYLAVIPFSAEETFYSSRVPSFLSYSLFDGFLVVRLAMLRARSGTLRWRAIYSWFLGVAVLWLLRDTLRLVTTAGLVPWMPAGNATEALWVASLGAIVVVTRIREHGIDTGFPRPVQSGREMASALPWGPFLPFALSFLLFHFALSLSVAVTPSVRLARDVCALVALLCLTGLAKAREKLLQARTRQLDVEHLRASQADYRAYHDALTGLPNRYLLLDRLELALAHARRRATKVAIMFVDLDRFKTVNDSLGHTAGDQLLQGVARRLKAAVRESDTLARAGEDEFMVLCEGIGSGEDAERVAAKLLEGIREPFLLGGREFIVTASIGISVYPDDGGDPDTLVKNADASMAKAKERGDCWALYEASMNARALEDFGLENSLRKAVSLDQFVIHYQPIVDVASGRVEGCEALLRWQHPDRGLLAPGEFIGLAEVTGVITQISPWILTTACQRASRWRASDGRPLSVAVNLSARQFAEPDLLQQVTDALKQSRLEPSCLELEITESLAMDDAEATIQTLNQLKALGVRISIDDFGTGYSSLSYLRRFPIDTLKIDKSFVDCISDPDEAAIVASVIAMARALRLVVVAEGIERDDELRILRGQGCDRAQGYLFSRPITGERFEELLSSAGSIEAGAWIGSDLAGTEKPIQGPPMPAN